jgi:hypothetical protein
MMPIATISLVTADQSCCWLTARQHRGSAKASVNATQ